MLNQWEFNFLLCNEIKKFDQLKSDEDRCSISLGKPKSYFMFIWYSEAVASEFQVNLEEILLRNTVEIVPGAYVSYLLYFLFVFMLPISQLCDANSYSSYFDCNIELLSHHKCLHLMKRR